MITESDINFRNLAYEINDGLYVSDLNGTLVYANLALAELFGYTRPAELIGKNFEDLISGERGHIFMNQFRKTLASSAKTQSITTEITRRDGKTATIEVNPMPFIKENKLLGSQGVVYDITERRQTEKEMMFNSTHDPVTGIYNRSFFEAELGRLERGRQFPISIIIVKVGFLMEFNESEDSKLKDKLIRRVGHRLFHSLRGDDIVARIAEDEFAILFPRLDENTVDDIIRRIRGSLQEINDEKSEPALEFFIGAGTAKTGERLNAVLRRAETIAYLGEKKKKL